ncbi:hypothetical protein AVV28_gp64 [Achromobacter phage JWX]|uniref:Uncharacterized protein n=1 Tax=Achromobacter phage JWX TaxID=1589746 RepID=A0A0B5A1R1_9CAUD|nr:hypothetical protein AVV28_gp64 [Achromobacter phage JWX]AJD82818.1 hypothetical protein JWX_00053 [Achromobacter phage JWX]
MNTRWRSEKLSHSWTDEQRQLQQWEDQATANEVAWYRQKAFEAFFPTQQLSLNLEFNNGPGTDPVSQRRAPSAQPEASPAVRADGASEPPRVGISLYHPPSSPRDDSPALGCAIGGPVGCFCHVCMKW